MAALQAVDNKDRPVVPTSPDVYSGLGALSNDVQQVLHWVSDIVNNEDLLTKVPSLQQVKTSFGTKAEDLSRRVRLVTETGDVASQNRVQAGRPCVLNTPPADGTVQDCSKVKAGKIPEFSGADPSETNAWLQKIITAATTANLSHRATIELMINRSIGKCNSVITFGKELNQSLEDIIYEVEIKCGNFPTPDECLHLCNTMLIAPGEDWSDFAMRLMEYAKLASRNDPTEAARMKRRLEICDENFKRNLKPHIYTHIKEKNKQRVELGQKEMDYNEMVNEVSTLTTTIHNRKLRERQESKLHELKQKTMWHAKPQGVNFVKDNVEPAFEDLPNIDDDKVAEEEMERLCYATGDDEDELSVEEEAYMSSLDELICEEYTKDEPDESEVVNLLKQAQKSGVNLKRYFNRGQGRPGGNRFQNRQGAAGPRKFPSNTNQLGGGQMARRLQQPRRLEDYSKSYGSAKDNEVPKPLLQGKPNISKHEIPKLANCPEVSYCFKCGMKTQPPHRASDMTCPLYSHVLMDRPCSFCGRGLHTPQVCLLAKTSDLKHPADRAAEAWRNKLGAHSQAAKNV